MPQDKTPTPESEDDEALDEALEETFPASDPIAPMGHHRDNPPAAPQHKKD